MKKMRANSKGQTHYGEILKGSGVLETLTDQLR